MISKVAASSYAQAASTIGSAGATASSTSTSPVGAGSSEQSTFKNTLKSAIGDVDQLQQNADSALKELASGENVDLHGTMIALEKADIALRAMVSVRDKLVSAYEQVMNTAI